jgi:hypothetical protein
VFDAARYWCFQADSLSWVKWLEKDGDLCGVVYMLDLLGRRVTALGRVETGSCLF